MKLLSQSDFAKIVCMPAPVDVRVLDDIGSIRAFAHPLRIRMLSMLQQEGPATATVLAQALGESTGATSYHLRQLARYGLIEEVEDRGNGRDRWWQAAARHYNLGRAPGQSEEQEAASWRLLAHVLERDAAVVASFVENRESYEKPWRNSAVFTNHVLYATPKELRKMNSRINEILSEFERPNPADRPRGALRFYGVLRLVPWRRELPQNE
jgi:DNA-binding transcriptional ArsR family regulator